MAQELWADNATGTVSTLANAATASLSVTTLTGAFPVPGAGQVFHIVVDFGTVAAEELVVTANSSGVFTTSTLAFQHNPGATVAAIITAAGLNSIASPTRAVASSGVALGTAYPNPNPYDTYLGVNLSTTAAETITVALSFDSGSTFQTVRTVAIAASGTASITQWIPVGAQIKLTRSGSTATITAATVY